MTLSLALVTLLASVASANPPRGPGWEFGGPLYWEVEHDEPEAGESGEVGETMEESGTWVRRQSNGIDGRVIATELTPGHVYTLAVVVFNHPDACQFAPRPGVRCGLLDLFTNPDAAGSVMWGDGAVATRSTVEFRVHRLVGNRARVFMGSHDALTDPAGAEITFDLFDAGLPLTGHLHDQQTSITFGCGSGEPNDGHNFGFCRDLAGNGM